MDKETKSPLDLVTELLAVMTARAVEAERQRASPTPVSTSPKIK